MRAPRERSGAMGPRERPRGFGAQPRLGEGAHVRAPRERSGAMGPHERPAGVRGAAPSET